MFDSHKDMQQRACLFALRSYQRIMEETIRRLLDSIKSLPENDNRSRMMDEIGKLDVTADAILWAAEMMDPEKSNSGGCLLAFNSGGKYAGSKPGF